MDKLKYVKLENSDGSYSNPVPLAVDGEHVDINGNSLVEELNKIETTVKTQKSRIDNITNLPEGSTSGDAELLDIRVGNDGTIYNNAGDSVRSQIENTKSQIVKKAILYKSLNILDWTKLKNAYINVDNGELVSSSNMLTSDFIKIDDYNMLYFRNTLLNNANITTIGKYDAEKNYLGYISSVNQYEIENNVIYVRLCSQYLLNIGAFTEIPVVFENYYEPYYDFLTEDVKNSVDRSINNEIKIANINKLIIKDNLENYNYYKNLTRQKQNFKLPATFEGTFKPINIFYDGKNFTTDYDKEIFKNQGGHIYYIASKENGGLNTNDGLTKEKPTLLNRALELCVSGDTIIALSGIYFKNTLNEVTQYSLNKSINLICEDNTIFAWNGYNVNYTLDKSVNLYKGSLTGISRIILQDLSYEFLKVETLEECQNNYGSYYLDGNNVYINWREKPYCITLIRGNGLNITDGNNNTTIYIENLINIGGNTGITQVISNNNILTTIYENCKFLYNTGNADGQNTTLIRGGYALFNKCINMFSNYDGFCYQDYTHTPNRVQFIEIDCIGANNGSTAEADNCNGSTAHHSVRGIRINCLYYNNNGGNVVDVQENCQTLNLSCEAYESGATTRKQGFSIQQDLCTMWLYNCKSKNNTQADLVCAGVDSKMYLKDCDFDTQTGNGQFIEI